MAVVVKNASRSMSWEQVKPYVEGITELFATLQKRFPTDLTVQSLLAEVCEGRKDLWLILDDDELIAVACSQIRTLQATGAKVLVLLDLAGGNIASWADELEEAMSAYGDEHGVDYLAVEGRKGWEKVIEKFGYREYARLWRRKAA